jgi:hypothetical protein
MFQTVLSKYVCCTKDLFYVNKFWFWNVTYAKLMTAIFEETKKCALWSHKVQSTLATLIFVTENLYALCQPR